MKGKIFNAQEVQAIIAGNKKMFREVIKVQPISSFKSEGKVIYDSSINAFMQFGSDEKYKNYCYHFGKTPYQVGQEIFCKESFFSGMENWFIMYAAKGKPLLYGKKRPAQHMKQEQSRLTLLIKKIKVERLAEISEEDTIKEEVMNSLRIVHYHPIEYFRQFWNATHKKPEEKFEASPFVWVISFEVVK